MSFHSTPASARALRIAMAPISIPVTPGNRPNGCSPTPTTATSISVTRVPSRASLFSRSRVHRPERERHDLVPVVVGAEGHHRELHLHAGLELLGIRLGEPGLDLHLVAEGHVAHAERHEVLARRAPVRRRGRREALGRPRPEAAAPGEQVLLHAGRGAARGRVLGGERHDSARRAARPDELRLLTGPREHTLRDRHAHALTSLAHALTSLARSSSFTTLPVAFTGSSVRNSTDRGTL